ncbi:MAG TPA: hypothetical protein VHY75_02620 [Steroidobacteraceae bacterium]|jgi:hypothetical protein|nr:hypothetical protein [Steroidobacteraceae bacterium]
MRSFAPAVLVCLAFAAVVGGWLIATAARGGSAATSATNSSAAASGAAPASAQNPVAAPAPTAPIDNIAPARHARRTACLKDAKHKRLVGAQRTAYVKNCMGSL